MRVNLDGEYIEEMHLAVTVQFVCPDSLKAHVFERLTDERSRVQSGSGTAEHLISVSELSQEELKQSESLSDLN